MEYCCHAWADAPSCFLELLYKPQKRMYRTLGPALAASREPLAYQLNVARLIIWQIFVWTSSAGSIALFLREAKNSDILKEFGGILEQTNRWTGDILTQLN